MREFLSVSAEVDAALREGRAVVALESTIITHGMPYPKNLEMARAVEGAVRAEGAVPATIAVFGGRLAVGLDVEGLEALARAGGTAAKASRRDLSAHLASGTAAGTTVAATMAIAAGAGIAVFATGGIGGVHRGAEASFDISADLEELARTPVAVVCAGAKSILDIAKTLEVLETKGVPVVGYRTDAFPAFWARESGHGVPHRCESPEEVARMIDIQARIGPGGVLIANPIPEVAALDPREIEGYIARAVADAEAEGVAHQDVTPFLLGRVLDSTGGRSLAANIALVTDNAVLAARIALALSAMR